MLKKTALAVFLCLALTLAAPAYEPGENLTLRVALLGPGTELYFWWGHISMLIEDSVTGRGRFFDYGLFSFDTDNFFFNFAMGNLIYSSGSFPREAYIANYMMSNRDITLFTLDVPPEKRLKVLEISETKILPENRYYLYHHFDDNCSTRIRDLIDAATGGQFREQLGEKPSRFTLRQHVRRHTWFCPFFDWLLNFLMGQGIDTPITVWEDMFLPSEVARQIMKFYFTWPDGSVRPLVSDVEVVFSSVGRPPVLDYPPVQWPRKLAFGLVVSVLLGVFSFLQMKKIRMGQTMLGISYCLAGLVFGIAGLTLYFMALFTNHDYTFHNANMLFGTPLLLAAVPLGISYARAKDAGKFLRVSLLLRLLWLLTLLGIFVSMFIKLFPQFWQDNLPDQMLMLPMALMFALHPAGLREVLDKYFRRR